MKKTIVVSIACLVLGFAPHVFAQGFVPLAPIPGLTQGVTANSAGLATFFNNLYKYIIGLAAILAVIEIIWGGLEYSTQDSVSKKSDGKERIYQAIFGLVLVLSPVLVFSIINPSILNLSLNLPKLDTVSGSPTGAGSGSGPGTTVTDPATQCSVIGTAGILQIANCPSETAGTNWGAACPGNLSTSPGTQGTKLADGTIVTPSTVIVTCSGKQPYVFVNTKGTLSSISSINRLQPLARTTDDPNNGNSAMSFASTCHNANLGRKTCISLIPLVSSSFTCQPVPSTPLPSGSDAIGKCYNETLTCADQNFVSSFLSSDACADGPSWAPFQ